MQGALRGLGHQVKIMCFNAVGFWGVGVTTGALLTFVAHWDLLGVWTGITLGVMSTCILNLLGLTVVNWQSCSEQASGSKSGGMQPDMHARDCEPRKGEPPGVQVQCTSWLRALWKVISGRGLGIQSTQEYSRVDGMHSLSLATELEARA
jgi:hypothetical protein